MNGVALCCDERGRRARNARGRDRTGYLVLPAPETIPEACTRGVCVLVQRWLREAVERTVYGRCNPAEPGLAVAQVLLRAQYRVVGSRLDRLRINAFHTLRDRINDAERQTVPRATSQLRR